MDAYTSGIHPDTLGSPRDVVLRKYYSNKKTTQTYELMANVAAATKNPKVIGDSLKKYVDSLWGIVEAKKDHYAEMLEYYEANVKHVELEATARKDERGETVLKVTGLEGLI